ncbi:winged helix-turn-helix domain-containing protein [Nonomuraea sp. C10]|uniref:winged helix-turn-helix domain-containing protein n=1 Tax=Nonomuraea sp. C10 TaxID=2600577 RepID=UPI0021C36A33|nr:winged helix-turn-helix domain-containing protein [Nonomuraea sp. C10]
MRKVGPIFPSALRAALRGVRCGPLPCLLLSKARPDHPDGPSSWVGLPGLEPSTRTVAARLRVHERSVTRWRKAWREGGRPALLSKGPVSREKLSDRQWARLDAELRRGPLAWGYAEDQCWTLGRVKTLIGRLFHIGYTIEGVGKLLHRHGWSVQVPARRAIERDEEAIALWKAEVWPAV